MISMQNAYALIIGIANYHHIRKLPTLVLKDARDIQDVLVNSQYCGYETPSVRLLIDYEATRTNILQELANLATRCNSESTVFIYISSHGGRIDSGTHAGEYLLPVDTIYQSEQTIEQTAISSIEITQALRAIEARKMVVVFDCCHSGGIGQPKDADAPEIKAGLSDSYYKTLGVGRGRVILASSRSEEVSWILPGASNSLFTQYLLDGLRGNVPAPGGVIRIFDLFDYVQQHVTRAQPEQHPIFKAELEENFPVALHQNNKSLSDLPATPEQADDGFRYDVFISYRHQNTDWVRKALVPSLKGAGIKIFIDYQDFRLGAALVTEMARGVEQSRYTLAVLTPAYLESNFTELENILAEHLGLEKSQRRLLAIMREECIPRLGIRARPWLDMTDEENFQENIDRLVYEFRLPPVK